MNRSSTLVLMSVMFLFSTNIGRQKIPRKYLICALGEYGRVSKSFITTGTINSDCDYTFFNFKLLVNDSVNVNTLKNNVRSKI